MLAALSMGGHLRVGMEDVLTLAKGVPVERNAQLVERAAAVADLAQRRPMSTAGARGLLGLAERLGGPVRPTRGPGRRRRTDPCPHGQKCRAPGSPVCMAGAW